MEKFITITSVVYNKAVVSRTLILLCRFAYAVFRISLLQGDLREIQQGTIRLDRRLISYMRLDIAILPSLPPVRRCTNTFASDPNRRQWDAYVNRHANGMSKRNTTQSCYIMRDVTCRSWASLVQGTILNNDHALFCISTIKKTIIQLISRSNC